MKSRRGSGISTTARSKTSRDRMKNSSLTPKQKLRRRILQREASFYFACFPFFVFLSLFLLLLLNSALYLASQPRTKKEDGLKSVPRASWRGRLGWRFGCAG